LTVDVVEGKADPRLLEPDFSHDVIEEGHDRDSSVRITMLNPISSTMTLKDQKPRTFYKYGKFFVVKLKQSSFFGSVAIANGYEIHT